MLSLERNGFFCAQTEFLQERRIGRCSQKLLPSLVTRCSAGLGNVFTRKKRSLQISCLLVAGRPPEVSLGSAAHRARSQKGLFCLHCHLCHHACGRRPGGLNKGRKCFSCHLCLFLVYAVPVLFALRRILLKSSSQKKSTQ